MDEEKLLNSLLGQEMKQQIQDARREHDEIRTQLDRLSAGACPRMFGAATSG